MDYDYIKQGDCINLIKEIPDNSIDLVVTDPPYELETSEGGTEFGKRKFYQNIDFMGSGFDDNILDELCRVMKKINIYLFCSQKQIMKLYRYFVETKKCNWNLLSWHKSNPSPTCGNKYLSDTEYIMFFREPGVKIYGTYETKKHTF